MLPTLHLRPDQEPRIRSTTTTTPGRGAVLTNPDHCVEIWSVSSAEFSLTL